MEGVDELCCGGSEVGGFLCFVVLHDWEPVFHGGVVCCWWGFAGLESFHGFAGAH